MRRIALPFACLASIAVAQSPPSPLPTPAMPAAPAPKPATVRVSLDTSAGPIILELEKERAPITTANFLHYLETKRMNGATFYRATRVGDGYGLVQGSLSNDPRKLFPPIAHEATTQTGLSHVDGAISMARSAPGSAQADFFITVGALTSMDADPRQPGDNLGFAVFGHVVEGMDVVRRILAMPTDPAKGEGVMRGQMLAAPVKIIAAERQN